LTLLRLVMLRWKEVRNAHLLQQTPRSHFFPPCLAFARDAANRFLKILENMGLLLLRKTGQPLVICEFR
jgi:hypothetical protein